MKTEKKSIKNKMELPSGFSFPGHMEIIVLSSCLILHKVISQELTGVITTQAGSVIGVVQDNGHGRLTEKYRGIPYAEPPLAMLRFKPPVSKSAWKDIYRATEFGHACMQDRRLLNKTIPHILYTRSVESAEYSEDCLYLNVFVPVSSQKRLKPVMVFIHGGDFQTGSASWVHHDGSVLAAEGNVVVVTCNYRLGVFGFLATGEGPAENVGLLDQMMALEWVRDNIESFGGDKARITVFGQGSGADSALFLLSSPLSAGLFHRVVLQSMGRFQTNVVEHEVAMSYTRALAESVECTWMVNSTAMLSCMQTVTAERLLRASENTNFQFHLTKDDVIISDAPFEMIEAQNDGLVPVLMSLNSDDGNVVLNERYSPHIYTNGLDSSDVKDIIQELITSMPNVTQTSARRLFDLIKVEYFSNMTDPMANLRGVLRMYTHYHFVAPSLKFTNTYLQTNAAVYNVYFTHHPSVLPQYLGIDLGTGFGEEMFYVFGLLLEGGGLEENSTEEERKLSRSIISTWTSFADNGKPLYLSSGDIERRPIPVSTPQSNFFLNFALNMTSSSVASNPLTKEKNFWGTFVPTAVHSLIGSCINTSEEYDTVSANGSIVATMTGLIRGVKMVIHTTGETWEGYFGVPYAMPPVGDLRWRKPIARRPWTGVLNTSQFAPSCMQYPTPREGMSEDCLYLNVWVPGGVQSLRQENRSALPLMVYIHGGEYKSGSGSVPGLHAVALHCNVILATLNYRLGALGFLSTEDEHCPGNFGLWDQLLALRWMKANAASFGGDPDRILVFGEGSGGASVSQLMVSPHAAGLFHRVVSHSGSLYAPWALGKKSRMKYFHLAEHLGCVSMNASEQLSCLKEKSAEDVVMVPQLQVHNPAYFGPVLDWDFFPGPMDLLFQQSHVKNIQFMGGAIVTEGYLSATRPVKNLTNISSYLTYIKEYLSDLYYNVESAFTAVRLQYFNNITTTSEIVEAGTMFFHDGIYAASTEKVAQKHSSVGGDTYSYDWLHRPSFSSHPLPVHKDDQHFIFGSALLSHETQSALELPPFDELDVNLTKLVLTYWGNFAHSGNPNKPTAVAVTWPQYTDTKMEYLVIRGNLSTLGSIRSHKREAWYRFWNQFMPEIDGDEAYFCQNYNEPEVPIVSQSSPTMTTTSTTTIRTTATTSLPSTSSVLPSLASTVATKTLQCQNRTEILQLTLDEAEAATFFLGASCFFLLLLLLILGCKIASLRRATLQRKKAAVAMTTCPELHPEENGSAFPWETFMDYVVVGDDLGGICESDGDRKDTEDGDTKLEVVKEELEVKEEHKDKNTNGNLVTTNHVTFSPSDM